MAVVVTSARLPRFALVTYFWQLVACSGFSPALEPLSDEEYNFCRSLSHRILTRLALPRDDEKKRQEIQAVLPPCNRDDPLKSVHFSELLSLEFVQVIGLCGVPGGKCRVQVNDAAEMADFAFDLALFASHVGRLPFHGDAVKNLYFSLGLLKRHSGVMPAHTRLLSDKRNASGCWWTRRAGQRVARMYEREGVIVTPMAFAEPSAHTSARVIQVLPGTAKLLGCGLPGASPPDAICRCVEHAGRVGTGTGVSDSDVELFVRLSTVLPAAARAFVIGNAFGFSTILLASLLKELGGAVDAIDGEVEGRCNTFGSWITRKLAAANGLDVALSVGMSPQDVPGAMRFDSYHLAFVDGLHTPEQMLQDLAAVEHALAQRAVVVLHDVAVFEMYDAVDRVPAHWNRHWVRGRRYKNMPGTVLLHRGFEEGRFDDY
eukprot:TRINITY_DN26660_c0_g1_i1.p1 TRINITY_DN26660_c0_g1~~TRINITY_DN26660_c0_g1_i1.p1  ORF type:complete len:431 (+),score=68.50 TRINITY_DN26660_c0_g1_i1:55-1347(+)